MVLWDRSRKADIGLRLVGLALCVVAGAAVALLHAHPGSGGGRPPSLPECGLAAIAFLSAVSGGSLIALGRHLFDEVDAGKRMQSRVSLNNTATRPTFNARAMRKSGIDLE